MRTVKQQRRAPGEENNERVNTATKKKENHQHWQESALEKERGSTEDLLGAVPSARKGSLAPLKRWWIWWLCVYKMDNYLVTEGKNLMGFRKALSDLIV